MKLDSINRHLVTLPNMSRSCGHKEATEFETSIYECGNSESSDEKYQNVYWWENFLFSGYQEFVFQKNS